MARSVLIGTICVFVAAGCAGRMQRQGGGTAAPALTLQVLRKQQTAAELRPMGPDETLHATEEVTVELRVDRTAYASAVLYSSAGSSEELIEDETPLRPDQPLRVTVPRRAPLGIKEEELRIFLAVSTSKLPPAFRQLLRLPCDTHARRGDPEPEKKDEKKDDAKRKGDGEASRSGKPPEGGPRGGDGVAAACASGSGLTPAVTLRALVLRSE